MKQVILIERSELADLRQGHTLTLTMSNGQPVLIALERGAPRVSRNGRPRASAGPQQRRRKNRRKLQAVALEALARAKRPVKLKDLKETLGMGSASRADKQALEKLMTRLANDGVVKRTAPGTYRLKIKG